MNVTLAFTARACPCVLTEHRCDIASDPCMTEDEARADVLRQAREWADAEPHWQWLGVVAGPVRPDRARPWWWEVDIALTPRVGTQLELALA